MITSLPDLIITFIQCETSLESFIRLIKRHRSRAKLRCDSMECLLNLLNGLNTFIIDQNFVLKFETLMQFCTKLRKNCFKVLMTSSVVVFMMNNQYQQHNRTKTITWNLCKCPERIYYAPEQTSHAKQPRFISVSHHFHGYLHQKDIINDIHGQHRNYHHTHYQEPIQPMQCDQTQHLNHIHLLWTTIVC